MEQRILALEHHVNPSNIVFFFFFFVMVVLVASNLVQMASAGNAMSVNILNEVGGTIYVHCKSKDNDLQEHTLLNGQDYGFLFHENFWGTTLFWCDFNWGSKWNSFPVWQIVGPFYDRKPMCGNCMWTVKPDGFYRSEVFGTPMFEYHWHCAHLPPQKLMEHRIALESATESSSNKSSKEA